MTKFKRVLIGTIGVYMFAVLSLVQAQNAPGADGAAPRVHSGQRIGEIYAQLNLTDGQKNQLEANKQQHRAKMKSAREAMKIAKQALQEALMSPQLDMANVNALHSQIKDLQSQMEDIRLSSILAVRSILTPDQFAKFVSLMHQHKQGHGE